MVYYIINKNSLINNILLFNIGQKLSYNVYKKATKYNKKYNEKYIKYEIYDINDK